MIKRIALIALTALSMSANAAVINIYDVNYSIGNLTQATNIINNTTATSTFSSDTINFWNNFPGGRADTFALSATGLFDTTRYSHFGVVSDDGFSMTVGSVTDSYFNNIAPTFHGWNAVADTGLTAFDLTYWENGGSEVLQVFGYVRGAGRYEAAVLPSIANVSEPGTLALLGLGLIGLASVRRTIKK